MTPYFRPYTNTDVVGVELGGAVKNVIALAVGMAKGMGHGRQLAGLDHHPRPGRDHPARAARRAPTPRPSPGSPGVGDLVATCMSPLSRNRTFGENLGHGMTLEEVVAVDPADRRGREVVRVDPGAGPGARRRHADHRARRRRGARRPAAGRDRAADHEPVGQVRDLLTCGPVVGKADWQGARDDRPARRTAGAAARTSLPTGDVLVLSGAGMSTESGIPDYRGPPGALRGTAPDDLPGVHAATRWPGSATGRAASSAGGRSPAAEPNAGAPGGRATCSAAAC